MGRSRRKFSQEFKLEALARARTDGRTLAQVARELELRPDLLRRWKAEFEPEVHDVGGEALTPAEELRRLRREVIRLKQERDFLKKATAFFAQPGR
jgi:transposase